MVSPLHCCGPLLAQWECYWYNSCIYKCPCPNSKGHFLVKHYVKQNGRPLVPQGFHVGYHLPFVLSCWYLGHYLLAPLLIEGIRQALGIEWPSQCSGVSFVLASCIINGKGGSGSAFGFPLAWGRGCYDRILSPFTFVGYQFTPFVPLYPLLAKQAIVVFPYCMH